MSEKRVNNIEIKKKFFIKNEYIMQNMIEIAIIISKMYKTNIIFEK
jgi:hypothetical protein